uniref:Transposase n=1 Tax=Ascaris lumbricoides TaxID=6252 RepID=A0A0M3IUF8_ASCLU
MEISWRADRSTNDVIGWRYYQRRLTSQLTDSPTHLR